MCDFICARLKNRMLSPRYSCGFAMGHSRHESQNFVGICRNENSRDDVTENARYYGNNFEYHSYQMESNRLAIITRRAGISITLEIRI